jgi:hypothetical protein
MKQLAYRKPFPRNYLRIKLVPFVDVTGERNIASQIAFGVSDRRALDPEQACPLAEPGRGGQRVSAENPRSHPGVG